MNIMFMPEVSPEERKILLEQNADAIEETSYQKPLTQEELDMRRESLTDNCIKLSELEEEKKELVKGYKDRMDPLISDNKILMSEVRTRQSKVDGRLFHMKNHDTSMMETYDEEGFLVSTRRLRPDEKQKTIMSQLRAAN